MSFFIKFAAKDRNSALSQLHVAYAPGSVKAFIEHALRSVKDGPVLVEANGHLPAGDGDYHISTAVITVTPVYYPPDNAAQGMGTTGQIGSADLAPKRP